MDKLAISDINGILRFILQSVRMIDRTPVDLPGVPIIDLTVNTIDHIASDASRVYGLQWSCSRELQILFDSNCKIYCMLIQGLRLSVSS